MGGLVQTGARSRSKGLPHRAEAIGVIPQQQVQ